MRRLLAAFALAVPLLAPAQAPAQSLRAINTGGVQGAYHTLFCPPVAAALQQAYFTGMAARRAAARWRISTAA